MSRQQDFESIGGAAYAFVMERPKLSVPWAKLYWRGDIRRFYERLSVVNSLQPGSIVVDCPAGAGVAFRALTPGDELDYVAVDASPAMLRKARAVAERDRLEQIRFVESDVGSLPLDDASADAYLSYWGLHCFADPEGALREAARVLKTGGGLHGVTFVRGDSWQQRHMIKEDVLVFKKVAFQREIEEWIRNAGFDISYSELHGPMFYFDAIRL